MRLEFSGAPEVAASREKVWLSLLDHEFVASCAPGVESAEAIDDTHFKVVAAVGVGPVKLRFQMDVELSDLNPPLHAAMTAKGKAPGSNVHVDTSVDLEEVGPDRTRLGWQSKTEVHGSVASVGARLLKGTTRKLIDDFWQEFTTRAPTRSG